MEKVPRPDLNWNFLRYFCEVAEHKSVRLAASRLGLSNSTVSEGVQSLEHSLNCKLLARHSRRVELTPHGGLLYNRIKPIFDRQYQIFESLEIKSMELPAVTVGLVPSNTLPASLDLIEAILKFSSATKFVVRSCNQETLERLMEGGAIDIGLSDATIRSRNVTSVKIADCKMRFFVHRDLADRPLTELLASLKIGLLGTGRVQQELQNRLTHTYPGIHCQFLLTDYATLLNQSCLHKIAIVGYASGSEAPVHDNLREIHDSVLSGAVAGGSQYLSWANRIEGSTLHEFLLKVAQSAL